MTALSQSSLLYLQITGKHCENGVSLRSWRFFLVCFPFLVRKVRDSAARKLIRGRQIKSQQKTATYPGENGVSSSHMQWPIQGEGPWGPDSPPPAHQT